MLTDHRRIAPVLAVLLAAVLLALACSKQQTAKPSAQAQAQPAPEPVADKATYRPSKAVETHAGFYMPGTQDLDACAVLTPGDLQPVLGTSIAKGASAVAGMSMCAYERQGGPDIGVMILTTAALRASAAEHFAKQVKSLPKEALTELPGAGDGAVFIAAASMMMVHKGDVIVQLTVNKPGEQGEGLTGDQARKLATIVAGKLAQLPAGAGQVQKAAPVANAAGQGSFDICGLVTDDEAGAIFGDTVRGAAVRGRDGTKSTDVCIYEDKRSGNDLVGLMAWTPSALKKAGHGTATQFFSDLVGSPIFGGQKTQGLGDEAARNKDMLVVRSKDSVLQIMSRAPEEKLKAFAKKALSRL